MASRSPERLGQRADRAYPPDGRLLDQAQGGNEHAKALDAQQAKVDDPR
jgi:hypothetical protein